MSNQCGAGEYNGWTNYETWRVNLEFFEGRPASDFLGYRVAVPSELEDSLRLLVVDHIYETTSEGIAREWAIAFIEDVNWMEIAEGMIEEIEDEEDATS